MPFTKKKAQEIADRFGEIATVLEHANLALSSPEERAKFEADNQMTVEQLLKNITTVARHHSIRYSPDRL